MPKTYHIGKGQVFIDGEYAGTLTDLQFPFMTGEAVFYHSDFIKNLSRKDVQEVAFFPGTRIRFRGPFQIPGLGRRKRRMRRLALLRAQRVGRR